MTLYSELDNMIDHRDNLTYSEIKYLREMIERDKDKRKKKKKLQKKAK